MPEQINTLPVESEQHIAPSLADNMSVIAERVGRLEAEAQDIAGTNRYPDWWFENTEAAQAVKQQLQDPSIDPQHISDYFELHKQQQEIRTVIGGHDYGISPLSSIMYEIGATTVTRGFNNEKTDGPIHAALYDRLLSVKNGHEHVTEELNILRDAYGIESMTGLLGMKGDEYADSLKPLLRTENIVRQVRYAEQARDSEDSWPQIQEKAREWMGRALSEATGIDETEAANYVFAASRRGEDKSIINILNKFDTFGVERLRALSDFTGIHAFETYTDAQLERMESILNDPESAAENLAKHDVNVVMVNRFGDHNGVLTNAADSFEDENDRTLFFEISNMSDIYRHMLTLRDAKVEPSTLILAAHSGPGQFIISDLRESALKRHGIATIAGRNLVKLINSDGSLEEGQFGYSMHGMKGAARIVEELMQPSRAIDDAAEDAGRKKVIFQACHAASEADSKDIDVNGDKITLSLESVISQLSKDLVANGVTSNVDIYGAPGGIQLHKSEQGVRYTSQPASFGEARQPQHAVRIRTENGNVSRQEVDEIILHK